MNFPPTLNSFRKFFCSGGFWIFLIISLTWFSVVSAEEKENLLPRVLASSPQNLLLDGSMETLGQNGSPWQMRSEAGGDGNGSFIGIHADGTKFLGVRTQTFNSPGGYQEIVFERPIKKPILFGGRARVNGKVTKTGAGNPDFDIYLDIFYEDGTPLWGQKAVFSPEKLGWQNSLNVFWPAKPIKRIQVFVLFRDHTGDVAFDDIFLCEYPFKLESLRAVGGLTGDGSIAIAGRFGWRKEFFSKDFRCEITQDGFGQLPFTQNGSMFFVSARPEKVGGVKSFRIKAWNGDELLFEKVFSCDTSRKTLPSHILKKEDEDFILWTESAMKRIYLHSLPEGAGIFEEIPSAAFSEEELVKKESVHALEVKLDMARRESESFQIACLAGSEIPRVNLEITDLVCVENPENRIPASACEWQQVGYLFTPGILEHRMEKNGTPEWYPDPLLPRKSGFVPANQTVSFWVTISTSAETEAGTYRGCVKWTPENASSVEIPVEVTVWPVTLPVEGHLGSAFALMDGYLEKSYGKDIDLLKVRRAFGEFMLRHRLSPEGDISRTEKPSLELLKEWKDRGLGYFNVLNMVEKRGENAWRCNSPISFYTPENREKILAELRPYVEELRKLGLMDRAYLYTFDESKPEYHPIMTEFFGMIKENFPDLSTFTTAYIGADTELLKKLNVDWSTPLTSVYDLEQAEICRKNGQKIWSYICCGPNEPYANIMLRFPLLDSRILGWQAFEQKYDGLLYWGMNIWSAPDNLPMDPEKTLFWKWNTGWKLGGTTMIYGDGRLVYPNVDGTPIGCLRLANLRDGYEDYELLWALNEKNPNLANEICRKVSASPLQFTRDPEILKGQRREILKALSEK